MAISFNTSAAVTSASSQVASQAITVPAGVLAGDVVLIKADAVNVTNGTVPTLTPSSTGTTPTQVGSTAGGSEPLPAAVAGALFYFIASGTDAGKVVTISTSINSFMSVGLAAYTGASNSTPIDVSGGAFGGANTNSVTCPSKVTGVTGDWAVYLGGGAAEGSANGTMGIPAGSTSRRNTVDGSAIGIAITDSNGSVGASGASIGGGTFTSASPTNAILTAFTVGLAPPGGGGAGPVVNIPTPDPQLVLDLLHGAWSRADWQAQGVADLTVAFSSSSSGIDTYNVTSPWNNYANAGAQQMRVLKPTTANANYPHAFLIMLPVDPNQVTSFGDSIGTAQAIGAHNTYNLTCIQPGYAAAGVSGTGPWFADNPLDPTISQEKYTLLVVNWIKANLATTGTEKVYLIGFSRSGLAAQFLQFRHPYLFSAVASWDSPFGMTDYDGTDPNGAVGGNSSQVFGTSASFQTNYELTAAHLGFWKATGQYGVNRIWIGQGPAFTDITGYDTALTTAGIPHTYTFSNTGETHAWQTDWVAAALASIIPSNWSQATTVLPQQIPHPLYMQLLEVADRRMTTGITPATVTGIPATLTLAAPGGTVSAGVNITGTTAGLTLAAPAGSVSTAAGVTGLPAGLTLTAPAGSVSAGANVTGLTAQLALGAPTGSVSAGANVTGVTAQLALGAPLGTLAAGANIAGTVAQLSLGAPAGTVTTGAGATGIPATLTFAAPAGSVQAGAVITGTVAVLNLGAPAGSTGQPGTGKSQMLLVFFP